MYLCDGDELRYKELLKFTVDEYLTKLAYKRAEIKKKQEQHGRGDTD